MPLEAKVILLDRIKNFVLFTEEASKEFCLVKLADCNGCAGLERKHEFVIDRKCEPAYGHKFLRILSLLFSNRKNRKTYGERVLYIKYVSFLVLTFVRKILPINIHNVRWK